MTFDIARISLIGDRSRNEDCVDVFTGEAGVVGVVADGLGGHAGGDLASAAFTRTVMDEAPGLLAPAVDPELEDARRMSELFARGAAAIRELEVPGGAAPDPRTTAAVVIVSDRALVVAHVGDSRIYRFSGEGSVWRSTDHSLAQLLVETGEISESEMGTHPSQSVLHRSVGAGDTDPPSVERLPALEAGELLLLCSDGLWEHTRDAEMAALAAAADLAPGLAALARQAVVRAGGRSDNVTALCIRRAR